MQRVFIYKHSLKSIVLKKYYVLGYKVYHL